MRSRHPRFEWRRNPEVLWLGCAQEVLDVLPSFQQYDPVVLDAVPSLQQGCAQQVLEALPSFQQGSATMQRRCVAMPSHPSISDDQLSSPCPIPFPVHTHPTPNVRQATHLCNEKWGQCTLLSLPGCCAM